MTVSLWPARRIDDLATVTRGASPRPIIEWVAPSGIPWIKIGDANATDSRFIDSTREFIKPEGAKHSVVVRRGDFVVSNSATPGIPRFIDMDQACIHDGWLLFRSFKDVIPEFLYYRIIQDREALLSQGNGSVFTNLKTDILKAHEIPLPPIEEQRGIAATLGALDDKIESSRRMINLAEELADQLFRAETGAPAALSDVATLTMGSSPPGETYNHEGEGLPFYQGVRDFGRRYPGHRVWTTGAVRLAQEDDTLVSVRAPVGELNRSRETCCIGRGVASVSCRQPSTLYYALRASEDTWEPFQHEGTVFGAINKNDLSKARLPWPKPESLLDLEGSLSAIDRKIKSLSLEIEKLSGLRDVLMPELLSGRIRVSDARQGVA